MKLGVAAAVANRATGPVAGDGLLLHAKMAKKRQFRRRMACENPTSNAQPRVRLRAMKLRLPSIALVALVLPIAGMAIVTACGGNEDNGDAGPDATSDAVPDVAKDSAPDVTDAGCKNDVDLTSYLPSADASFDVDAGINISQCTGCLKTSCGTDINACNQDCDCRQDVVDVVTCVANGGAFQTCAIAALGNQNVQNLFSCALGSCSSVCIPADGGAKDAASDAPKDAPGDGG